MGFYGYARVSTDRQAESGLSLDAQKTQIQKAAELGGHNLVRIFTDAGESGRRMDRPALGELLDLVQQGQADGLIVSRLDRISRSLKDLVSLIELLQKKGIMFVSVAESVDTGSAAGRLLINIVSSIAQFEAELVSERTKAALGVKRAKGFRIGTVPYGFTADEAGKLKPAPREREVLAMVRRLRKKGESWVNITYDVNDAGFRNRAGREFSRQSVRQLAQRASIG